MTLLAQQGRTQERHTWRFRAETPLAAPADDTPATAPRPLTLSRMKDPSRQGPTDGLGEAALAQRASSQQASTSGAAARIPLVLLAVCAMALVYLVQTSGIATTGYDLQRLQAERGSWVVRNEQLRLELAKRRSLVWVEAEAVGRLGMRRPEQVIYLRAEAPGGTQAPVPAEAP